MATPGRWKNRYAPALAGWLGLCAATALYPVALAGETDELPVRGVVRPFDKAAISTDLVAIISSLKWREGDRFKKGDVLVTFDCGRLRAERETAIAERKVQKLTVENNQTLRKHRAIGQFDLGISLAKLVKADAEIKVLDARISHCVIKAPFAGRVDKLLVRENEMPPAGTPIINVIDDSALEVELIVPSKWLVWLKQGSRFNFVVDENARSYAGEVSTLSASVDPVSQTIAIKGKLVDAADGILAGMSGTAKFLRPEG